MQHPRGGRHRAVRRHGPRPRRRQGRRRRSTTPATPRPRRCCARSPTRRSTEYDVRALAAVHRVGDLAIGDIAVIVAVACAASRRGVRRGALSDRRTQGAGCRSGSTRTSATAPRNGSARRNDVVTGRPRRHVRWCRRAQLRVVGESKGSRCRCSGGWCRRSWRLRWRWSGWQSPVATRDDVRRDDSDAALARMQKALARPAPAQARDGTAEPREHSHGVAVRRASQPRARHRCGRRCHPVTSSTA